MAFLPPRLNAAESTLCGLIDTPLPYVRAANLKVSSVITCN